MSDEAADREAIIALIHRNRIAVWTQNFAEYEKCFVHALYTTRWNASPTSGIFVREGWDEIAGRARAMFSDPKVNNHRFAYETTVEDLKLRIHGDMAWAVYRQRYPDVAWHHAGPSPSYETRIFERQDGQWRIAFLGFLDGNARGQRDGTHLTLAPDGTVLEQSPAAIAAMATEDDLVIRAGKLHVRDSRTDKKLQAAIRWAAAFDAHLVPGRGALPIVLQAGEGVAAKVSWVIAEGGKVLFSLSDPAIDEHRIEAAAAVYGLSAAQKKVAVYVIAGLTQAEIAERMEITPNTARTHLNRIFDKTGVRTQPALVRVLLSAVSPL